MAINLKGKKTSLEEEALIYEQRNENQSEKEKWSQMDAQQKRTHFMTYYLKYILIGLVICIVAGFFIYSDVIRKKEVVYNCALVNERATELPIEGFSQGFLKTMNLDPEKNMASFHMFFTDGKLAQEVGASAASDLTQISAEIVAAQLDSMIADETYIEMYRDNNFFEDLSTFLTQEEQAKIEKYFYIPKDNNPEQKPYGIYLDQCEKYQEIFEGGGGIVEKPIFGIITNSSKKESSRKLIYYMFPELQE